MLTIKMVMKEHIILQEAEIQALKEKLAHMKTMDQQFMWMAMKNTSAHGGKG